VADRPASLSGCSTESPCSCRRRLGGQVRPLAGGGPQACRKSSVQASSQGQSRGRCRMTRRAEDAIRAGTWMSLRRVVAVVALAKAVPVAVGSVSPAARVAAARVRLNAMTASTSQAVFAVNFPEGRCASAELLRSAVVLPDLFDDRVVPVGLVGGDGVEHVGAGGGEERVEAPHIE